MVEEQASAPGTEGGASGPSVAAAITEAPAPSAAAQPGIIADAETEIRKLAQELHDKITALGGQHWIADLPDDLKNARADVESAVTWVVRHFQKQGVN